MNADGSKFGLIWVDVSSQLTDTMQGVYVHVYLVLYTKAHIPADVYSSNKGWKLLQALKGFGPNVEGAIYFLLTEQHLVFWFHSSISLHSP